MKLNRQRNIPRARATFRLPLYGGVAGVKVVRGAHQAGAVRLHLDPPHAAKFLPLGIARGGVRRL